MIEIEQVDHIGIRVTDVERALAFYALLGFGDAFTVPDDDVTIIRNRHGVEINLVTNGTPHASGNVLMDETEKYPGYTHVALRVPSVRETMLELARHAIPLSGGPVDFGGGHLSIFVRDPDRNVIELRGGAPETLPAHLYGPQ